MYAKNLIRITANKLKKQNFSATKNLLQIGPSKLFTVLSASVG